MTRLTPELAWIDGRFEPGVAIEVDEDGRIATIDSGGGDRPDAGELAGAALLPGFVDAHSHAFQVGLRGLGETYAADGGDFWSWREAMYDLVDGLDGDAFEGLCRRAFAEMLAAGITTVGEFHYLHHFADTDHALDRRLLAAASGAGIRLALLLVYYRTGGIDAPLEGAQRRFSTPDPKSFWSQFDTLARELDPATQSLGVAVHSIRAADPGETAEISAEARRRGLVCHMHLEEQPREIAETRARYGAGPLRLLLDRDAVGEHFTGVHLTHSSSGELEEFFRRGGKACICPLTEGNLGDGVPALTDLAATSRLSLGTDSNARISMLEEARWLEYGQRLRSGRRGVLREGDGPARELLEIATAGGADSLGIGAGRIVVGCPADFAVVDLSHPALAGWSAERLPAQLAFGVGNEVIAATWVGGREVCRNSGQ